jgi:hypothetical protein
MPAGLRTALIANATALAAWKALTPLARNEFICWVLDAKQHPTRERRIRRTQGNSKKDSAGPAAGPDASTASATASSAPSYVSHPAVQRAASGGDQPLAQRRPVRSGIACGTTKIIRRRNGLHL